MSMTRSMNVVACVLLTIVLLVVPAAASTTAELYEAAKAEGKVVIYGFSSRIFDVKDSFEAEYPGITVEAYDMSSFELLEKLEREYAAGIRNADAIFVSDSEGTLRNSLLPQGIVENYVPEELIDVIPESLREPLLAQFIQMNVPYYNPKVFSEQPISSWWDLTLPEWRGKIIMNDPLRSAETLGMLITMVQRGDEMAIAYEERFGEPIETRPNENAGHEFIRRLAANDPVFMTSGGDVVSAISASDQPLIGLASSPKLRDVDTKGLSLAVAWDITPAVSVTTNAYLALAADAPHPNAARLLIHWMMGDSEGGKGYAPFHVQGSWSSRTDVPPPPNTPDLSSLTYWEDDPEYVWTNGLQIRDFWLTVNR